MQNYEMLFKRKSFHLFNDIGQIEQEQLDKIYEVFKTLEPLDKDIKVAINIVKANACDCHRHQEYCILFYSEKKANYLTNIGYLGEQLDLYLTSMNIGTLWYGIGKETNTYQGLDYVIMMAISQVQPNQFRKDMFAAKRKPLAQIWQGEDIEIANIVRFAPSACNLQPWQIVHQADDLFVYRYSDPLRRGIMPKDKVLYYNHIDIGILLVFIEVCLQEKQRCYRRELLIDSEQTDKEMVCIYHLGRN